MLKPELAGITMGSNQTGDDALTAMSPRLQCSWLPPMVQENKDHCRAPSPVEYTYSSVTEGHPEHWLLPPKIHPTQNFFQKMIWSVFESHLKLQFQLCLIRKPKIKVANDYHSRSKYLALTINWWSWKFHFDGFKDFESIDLWSATHWFQS